MATVHVGANADPHRASFWLAPPEGWLVPAEGRRASTTPYVLTHRAGRLRVAVTPIRDRTTARVGPVDVAGVPRKKRAARTPRGTPGMCRLGSRHVEPNARVGTGKQLPQAIAHTPIVRHLAEQEHGIRTTHAGLKPSGGDRVRGAHPPRASGPCSRLRGTSVLESTSPPRSRQRIRHAHAIGRSGCGARRGVGESRLTSCSTSQLLDLVCSTGPCGSSRLRARGRASCGHWLRTSAASWLITRSRSSTSGPRRSRACWPSRSSIWPSPLVRERLSRRSPGHCPGWDGSIAVTWAKTGEGVRLGRCPVAPGGTRPRCPVRQLAMGSIPAAPGPPAPERSGAPDVRGGKAAPRGPLPDGRSEYTAGKGPTVQRLFATRRRRRSPGRSANHVSAPTSTHAVAPDPRGPQALTMGILTEDMKRVVEAELGFIATVCPDGTPNLSPKGTTAVWDDDHLVFADIGRPARSRTCDRTASRSTSSTSSSARATASRGRGRSTPRATSSSAASGSTRPVGRSGLGSASEGS